MLRSRLLLRPLLCLALASCHPAPTPAPTPPDEHGAGGERVEDAPAPERATADPRALGADATFADLVASIQAAETGDAEAATADCILRPGEQPRLEGEVSAAVHPIADAPAELGARLTPAPIAILSRFGARGPREPSLAVATLTATEPPGDGEELLLTITSRGVMLRSTDRREEPGVPFDHDGLAARLSAFPSPPQLVAVTAEASVPLARVAETMAALPDGWAPRTALAVALPPGTRTPEAAASTREPALCEDLAALPEDADEGSLSRESLLTGVTALRAAVARCVEHAGATARGGRMVLRFRVGPEGEMSDACVTEDATGSTPLRACVLETAHTLHFARPNPTGFVDAAIPLTFDIERTAPRHVLCGVRENAH